MLKKILTYLATGTAIFAVYAPLIPPLLAVVSR